MDQGRGVEHSRFWRGLCTVYAVVQRLPSLVSQTPCPHTDGYEITQTQGAACSFNCPTPSQFTIPG